MSKTALVTGANGFVGTHMVELLLNNGYNVIATDLEREHHKKYYCEEGILHPSYTEGYAETTGVKFIAADLTNKETLYPLFEEKLDLIFHVASLYDYFALWDVLYKVNVEGTKNLSEVAVEKGVRRLVHWSTEGVYGETDCSPADEDFPKNPTNLYSKSKLKQEKILWALQKDGKLDLTIVRPGPIYGPRHYYGTFHILYGIARLGMMLVPIIYPKKRTLMFPSVEVRDLVRAAHFLAEKEEAIGEAYNVLSDAIPQADVLEFLANHMGNITTIKVPVPWALYKAFARLCERFVRRLDLSARKKGIRPKVDVPMAEYITHQYWFSNDKLKSLGFKFIYEDPRKGLYEFIGYCKERGRL